MTDFNLTSSRFPDGTSVEVYAVSDWLNSAVDTAAAPPGTPVDTVTVTDGVGAVTGLTAGETYVAYAEINSEHVYVTLVAGADVSNATSQRDSAKGFVNHGATADVARPAFASVEWVGSVEPTNAIDGDSWISTA